MPLLTPVLIMEIEKLTDNSAKVVYDINGELVEKIVSLDEARKLRVGSYINIPTNLIPSKKTLTISDISSIIS